MTIKMSEAVRNAMLNAIETTIGTAPKLRIYTGTAPAELADAATGTLLAEMDLPSDWLAPADEGTIAKAGDWLTNAAVGDGEAGYYRITNTAGTTAHEQGSISDMAGSGDMKLDNINIAIGQQVVVAIYEKTAGNA